MTSEQALVDIKYLYEQEKIKLEERLEKAVNELRMVRLQHDNKKESDFFAERGLNELHELSSRISVLKRQRDEDILDAQKERDEALRRVERLENALKATRETSRVEKAEGEKKAKGLEQKLSETRGKLVDQDRNQGEILKLRKQVTLLKCSLSRAEETAKNYKSLLTDKENEIESERINLKRQLISERKKLHTQREAASKAKDEFEKRRAVLNKELLHLREHIKKYQEHINTLKKENSEIKLDLFRGPNGPLSNIEGRP